jgi:hemerythrin-like metal-binding protein
MTDARVLAWSEQLETGLPDVDDQHQQLIEIINRLGDLHAQEAKSGALASVLAELRDYTVYHFDYEASLMESLPVNEANKALHLKDHQGFVDIVLRAQGLMSCNPADVTNQLLAYLVKWLVHHITGIDRRLAREIIALRTGVPTAEATASENPLHDALINTVSDLYDSIGVRTFEVLDLNRQLEAYRNKQEEENALTQAIIMRLIERSTLSTAQIEYWYLPTETFSGDTIAAVPGPDGRLYALMADATGHGLAAAITVLPVLSVFHALAKRGRSVKEILVEINRNLLETLPPGRFVAATLLCVHAHSNLAEVWIGGMPDLLLLEANGQLVRTLSSTQLALGIVDFDEVSLAIETMTCPPGSQFVMYSDGLVEATNMADEPFGEERFHQVLQMAEPRQRIAAVQSAMVSHIGAAKSHDDISLMLINLTGTR